MAKDSHYGLPGIHREVRCADCALVFLNPMYSDEELAKLYEALDENYFAYQDHFKTNWLKQLTKKLLGYYTGTKDPHFRTPGTFLDLGCGSGWFVNEMANGGWQSYGVEINEQAAKFAQQSKGLNIFCGSLPEAGFPSAHFDYVRANHSFEHITSPDETLREIHRILKPGGKLFIGVPNIEGMNARIFRQYWWHLAAPVHAFSYSRRTLCGLLERHGFRVRSVTFNSDYFGLLGSFQIWVNRNSGKRSMEGSLVNNHALRLLSQWVTNLVDLVGLGDAMEITAESVTHSV